MDWNLPAIRNLIRLALVEDSAHQDVTTHLLIGADWKIEAAIVAKQKGTLAGLPFAERIFKTLDPTLHFKSKVLDGTQVQPGKQLAIIKGSARSVLSGERPALNALQHLSGIATYTHAQVEKLKGSRTRLYDTRKTLPGWRFLQKYAVRCGGAYNQRLSLGDAVMIKENHLKVVRLAGDNWKSRVKVALKKRNSLPFQMEVQDDQDIKDALVIKPPRVLLDNLPHKRLKKIIPLLRNHIPGLEIEITGGVKPEDLRSLAQLRPERISMGRLTHSVPAFDCSLDILHVYTK